MKESVREKIRRAGKTVLSVSELRRLLGGSAPVVRVMLSRWTRERALVRVGTGLYALSGSAPDPESVASQRMAPSYVSFSTVFAREGWLSTIPREVFFATPHRSRRLTLLGRDFVFRKIPKELFRDYRGERGIPSATPEKALLDYAYLVAVRKVTWPSTDLEVPSSAIARAKKELKKYSPTLRAKLQEGLARLQDTSNGMD